MRNNHSRIHNLGNTSQLVHQKLFLDFFQNQKAWMAFYTGIVLAFLHILYLPNAFIAKANIDRGVGTREI
jgi:hypothetical protein